MTLNGSRDTGAKHGSNGPRDDTVSRMPARGSSTPTRSRGPARSGPATRSPAKKPPARKPAARGATRSRPPARRGPNPFVAVLGAVLRGFAGFWMLVAGGAGSLARAAGRQAATARDLEP
ncbi:MAG: Cell division protein FtsK, partial [Mycobacterium sp.]|nr:Cell division protein FtsK [Mycobacterium sp.]